MKNLWLLAILVSCFAWAQKPAPPKETPASPDVSGMYAFLREGEFVEVDVDAEKVTGFISRYGSSESDRGQFLDHLFKTGSYDGKNLTFTTREIHGVSFEFKGQIVRGEGKTPGSEGYYVLKGTLTEITLDANKKASSRAREVELKSFPTDLQAAPAKKD